MKNQHPLDKQIREQLEGLEMQPSPEVWENIDRKLIASSRRMYYFFLPIALIAIAATTFWLWPSDDNDHQAGENSSNISEVAVLSDPSETGKGLYIDHHKAEDYSNRKNSNREKSATSSAEVQLPQKQHFTPSASSGTEFDPQEQIQDNSPAFPATSAQSNTGKETKNKGVDRMEPHRKTIEDGNRGKVKTTGEREAGPIARTNAKTESDGEQKGAVTMTEAPSTSEGLNSSTIQSKLDWEDAGFDQFEVNHFLQQEERQKRLLKTHDQCAFFYPTNECPTFKDGRKRYQVDVYGLTGYLDARLSSSPLMEPELSSYLETRKNTETSLWTLGVGVRLSTQWTNGISLRGGLQFTQGEIRMDYRDETQSTRTVNVAVDTIVDNQGNTTVVWDTLSIEEEGVIDRREYNVFRQIDIPVTVGYTFLGRNYDIEVNGGVAFNLLFEKSGRVFAPEDDQFYGLSDNLPANQKPYRDHVGISLIGSVALNYHLTPQFSVFAEPQLRYFMEPVSGTEYPLNENWFQANLLFGGRYAF